METMNAPLLILLALQMINIGIALAEHGKPKEGKHNAWITIIGAAIGTWLVLLAVNNGCQ